MTPQSALDTLLAVQLRFGNGAQIEALSVLRMAEELLDLPRACPECDGEGEIENAPGYCSHCGRECSHCGGEGSEQCPDCKGSGVIPWTRDHVYRLSAENIKKLLDASGWEKAA
jgi:Zn finger protein HypA/HybF involved in hydrogenase expression